MQKATPTTRAISGICEVLNSAGKCLVGCDFDHNVTLKSDLNGLADWRAIEHGATKSSSVGLTVVKSHSWVQEIGGARGGGLMPGENQSSEEPGGKATW